MRSEEVGSSLELTVEVCEGEKARVRPLNPLFDWCEVVFSGEDLGEVVTRVLGWSGEEPPRVQVEVTAL